MNRNPERSDEMIGEPSNEMIDEVMLKAYESNDASSQQLRGNVMSQIASSQSPVIRKSIPANKKVWAVVAIGVTAILGGVLFFFMQADPSDLTQTKLPKKESRTVNKEDTTTQQNSTASVVMLDLPASNESAQMLPKSQWIPKDVVLLVGRLANARKVNDEAVVDFKVDRVLRGAVIEGVIVTKDEFNFSCHGPVSVSGSFPYGKPLIAWLSHEDKKWTLLDLHASSEKFLKTYEAVTCKDQEAALRPLLLPHGFNYEIIEMIKMFASIEQTTPLLEEMVRTTPALLKEYPVTEGPLTGDALVTQNKNIAKRQQIFAGRLEPAISLLIERSQWQNPELIDQILACYPLLEGKGDAWFQFHLNTHLNTLLRVHRYDPTSAKVSEQQLHKILELYLEQSKVADKNRFGYSTAIAGLGEFHETAAVDRLLEEQAKRPVGRAHSTISMALWNISYHTKVSAADKERIKTVWMKELLSLDEEGVLSEDALAVQHARSFANQVAGGVYRAGVNEEEKAILKQLYDDTEHEWLRGALERFFKEGE